MKKDLFKLCFFVVLFVATLIGCESESKNITEHKIIYARYTSALGGIFSNLKETLEVTYINKDGELVVDLESEVQGE